MNFYKRHIGDYIKDAGHLKLLEHGVYARLMDVYYTREAGIPDDKAARLVGASSRQEIEALNNVLSEFFILTDGTWTQKRCEEEIAVATAKAEKNRANGKAGGRPKKTATEGEPKENPDGSDVGNHVGFKKNLSQTPDSRLQTPDLKPYADDDSTDSSCAGETEAPREAPLPTREKPPLSDDPAIQLTVALRRQGVNVMSTNPHLLRWVAEGVTLQQLTEAVAVARETKGDATIAPGYLVPIIDKLRNPPAPTAAAAAARDDWSWKRSDEGIARKARELGLHPRPTESYRDLADRCEAEVLKRKGKTP